MLLSHDRSLSDTKVQEDELLALESIYDPSSIAVTPVNSDDDLRRGTFISNVTLPQTFNITAHRQNGDIVEYPVRYLPPISLSFTFPHNYPSTRPPLFNFSCPWLTDSQHSRISAELDRLWSENVGIEILFTWTSFLQNDLLEFLDIRTPLVLGSAELPAVLEYDVDKRAKVFSSTAFTCLVCFREKAGSACIQFPGCQHVYCKECMKGYFEMHIRDGSVRSLECPTDKCRSEAGESQVKELVGKDLFERYDRLLLQLSLDMMSDVVYCPRPACASVVIVDSDADTGSCPVCSFVFCMGCKKLYHGVEPCWNTVHMTPELTQLGLPTASESFSNTIASVLARNEAQYMEALARNEAYAQHAAQRDRQSKEFEGLVEEFKEASRERKKEMIAKHGEHLVPAIVNNRLDLTWIQNNTKQCPACRSAIEKISGCNHMVCYKCRTDFCWLCLSVLVGDVYRHYKEEDSPCFRKQN